MTAPDQLDTLLPPAADPADLGNLDDLENLENLDAPAAGPRDLTPADLEAIEDHITGAMRAAAQASAQLYPLPLQDAYVGQFMDNNFIRAGVRLTGVGEALHELLPPAGEGGPAGGAPAVVRQLHPVARLLLGAVVLGVGVMFQRRKFDERIQQQGQP